MGINLVYIQILTLLRLIYFYKFAGLSIFFKLIGKKGLAEIQIPANKQKFYLRKGTSDIAVFVSIYAFNEFKSDFSVSEKGVILDFGANIGISTAYFAEKYPQALIIALEPSLASFELLKKNTQSYDNVICLQAAVWKESCELFLQNPEDEDWALRFGESKNSSSNLVQAISVKDLMRQYNINKIDIMKIDIEGAEKDLFSGNFQDWIHSVNTYLIEFHDAILPGCSSAFYRALGTVDFVQSILGEKVVVQLSPSAVSSLVN
ncbi:FkbM family methyltransferase [Nostoc sp. CCY 9925]|uniref:FkbM family methyltransferase n=1 Tax=Nostoc sp. CCY 9925 TaxID=3103865 RepID=UPI0039C68F75